MNYVSEGFILLFAIMLLAIFAQNRSVVYAVLIVFILKILRLDRAVVFLEAHGLRWSIIFLTAAVLAPFASDTISIRELATQFKTPLGITAIIMGAFSTYLARQGVTLLDSTPDIVPAMVIGTIIGISFFRGIPVGPLVSSGILAVIFAVYNMFR
ncbi:DUF441 domain-containing protein [Alkalicella caledoniensis]|uniref:UPF0756 membrane protein HYG86_06740 n=1 Tax=Alkalicella caledoniensis TaxID=2731377 RepID=A0A7G9W731_ALKCA|nr:DUF441 domain-containing protein [Alkalicella caledoniensis]QNO14493.1 DUF441 domain-containing protein [Alkalicella caledoniensis]